MQHHFVLALLLSFFLFVAAIEVPLVRKVPDEHPEFRHLRSESNGYLPLSGSAERLGEYYMQFSVGTPPQHFSAQVDTGSSDLAIPAQGCSDCGTHPDQPFTPSASSTFSNISCNAAKLSCPNCISNNCAYELSYLDGSGFNATLGNDTMNLAGFSFYQDFGLITNENNPGFSQFEPFPVDGIAGFAYTSISEVFAPTIIESMVKSGEIEDIFSMCLSNNGGVMTLGEVGNHYTGEIQYTPITQKSWYVVELEDIEIFGQSIGVNASIYNSGDTIIDSGTTLMYLPYVAYYNLAQSFSASCPSSHLKGVCEGYNIFLGYCVSLSSSDIEKYPDIVFTFGSGIKVSLPPQYYLVQGYCDGDDYALGIGPELRFDGTILGDTFMSAFECIFDRKNSRMGFAPVNNCN